MKKALMIVLLLSSVCFSDDADEMYKYATANSTARIMSPAITVKQVPPDIRLYINGMEFKLTEEEAAKLRDDLLVWKPCGRNCENRFEGWDLPLGL